MRVRTLTRASLENAAMGSITVVVVHREQPSELHGHAGHVQHRFRRYDLDTAVTRQKNVVLDANVPGAYDEALSPVATCGGGLLVPKAMLYVVPVGPGCQLKVGVALTPAPPSDGLGPLGVGGAPLGTPAVVNDHVSDGATSDGFTAVANVRETTFQ